MHGTPKSLQLCISDDGVGFAYSSESRAGLGLVSMRERLYLIGGKFTLHSKPGCGTRVEGQSTCPIPISQLRNPSKIYPTLKLIHL
jgi:signal transduction histidine kinase